MIDSLIIEFDKALRTLFVPAPTVRPVPGGAAPGNELTEAERTHAGALMRINHVGEICAQALYQGQALACRDPHVRDELKKSGQEETEHLAWTEHRISELGGRKSLLNPFWYAGAFSFGVVAGKCGDDWSLGFLAETERQVEAHLDHHLSELPTADAKSRAIVEQMKADEVAHAEKAEQLGARPLPSVVRQGMRAAAKVMTSLTYYV
ncbi:2-polyprenyl-3-methyl-6-methoxy-1,4-benzoquinone monooxygenase [Propionivibrio limicola]|uniref:2-polyprenyl-3-methyl-6-methoxy-1,4-benzoquinone monooxygenase n=1 Tax=Propionivibrio limicola TaxID=167645 RepID=UPI001290DEB9|nr:2-polyprenyl-3-methyl-6-methoxy-1,4-benzoquinone monooxygenase [Propionivibrio limicola]